MMEDALQVIIPRLGWRLPGSERPVPIASLSVAAATTLQLQPVLQLRQQCHDSFLQSALGLEDGQQPSATARGELACLFQQLWALKWENIHKEVFWRLAVNGNSGAPVDSSRQCLCDGQVACRKHRFWDCSVAAAVRNVLSAQLPPNTDLQPCHVWLMRSPHPSIYKGVWQVVCLAALGAMAGGSRLLGWYQGRLHAGAVLGDGVQTLPTDPVAAAGRRAGAMFWGTLAEFTALRVVPPGWEDGVGTGHAFLRVVDGSVRLHNPVHGSVM